MFHKTREDQRSRIPSRIKVFTTYASKHNVNVSTPGEIQIMEKVIGIMAVGKISCDMFNTSFRVTNRT